MSQFKLGEYFKDQSSIFTVGSLTIIGAIFAIKYFGEESTLIVIIIVTTINVLLFRNIYKRYHRK